MARAWYAYRPVGTGVISVVIVDDHPLYRQGLAMTVQGADDLALLGDAGSIEEFDHLQGHADVVLLDLHLPGIEGAAGVKHVFGLGNRVLVVSAAGTPEDIIDAIAAGAAGYLTKEADAEEITRAIRTVADDHTYVSPTLASFLLRAERDSSAYLLTARERNVLALVAAGETYEDIADELAIDASTVHGHIREITDKAGAVRRAEVLDLGEDASPETDRRAKKAKRGDRDYPHVGDYKLVKRLGAGGMGVVYLAERSGSRFALKLMRPELAEQPEFLSRFQREMDAARRVAGICTARVVDAGTDRRRPYFVTEYIDGPTLQQVVERTGPLPGPVLTALAIGLAEALVAIHDVGLVHRDLKPANVLMAKGGPRVIDFGIAHAADATAITQPGLLVGSPAWMSPEQVTGHAISPASDLFAWAANVVYAACASSPFGAGPPEAILYRVVNAEPDVPALPDELTGLVEAALSKSPEARPSARDLLAALAPRSEQSPSAAVNEFLAANWQARGTGRF